jgi:transcriptional regulator with XRE-family HTH domain
MSKSFADLLREAESREEYWVADAVHGFAEDLVRAMERQQVSRTQLAAKLGASPAYITKILRGNANFTLRSMVRIARALGLAVRARLVHPDAATVTPFERIRRLTLVSQTSPEFPATAPGFADIEVTDTSPDERRATDSTSTRAEKIA